MHRQDSQSFFKHKTENDNQPRVKIFDVDNNHTSGMLDFKILEDYEISDAKDFETYWKPDLSLFENYQPDNDNLENTTSLEEAMKSAVYQIGPRDFNLDLQGKKKIKILLIGCPGQGKGPDKDHKSNQEKVAELLNSLPQEELEDTLIFGIDLGDNIYEEGAKDPFDKGFDDCFHDQYGNPTLTFINKIPFFLISGNHDANLSEKVWYYNNYVAAFIKYLEKKPTGDVVLLNELAHTFALSKNDLAEIEKITSLEEKRKKIIEKIRARIAELKQEIIDLRKLSSQWNMPFFFYSLTAGDTKIFCLDSNTFGEDFVNLFLGKVDPKKPNQFAWLLPRVALAKKNGQKVIFAQHNFLFSNGKRVIKTDIHHYMSNEMVMQLKDKLNSLYFIKFFHEYCVKNHVKIVWKDFFKKVSAYSFEELVNYVGKYFANKDVTDQILSHLPPDTNNYGELITRMYECLDLHPDLILCAHDHYFDFFNNKHDPNARYKFCQFTCGGSGGHKQEPKSLVGFPYSAPALSEYGCAELTFAAHKPSLFKIMIHSLKGLSRLLFTTEDHLPKHDQSDVNTEKLRQAVLKICNTFLLEKKLEEKIREPLVQGSVKQTSNYEYYKSWISPNAWVSPVTNLFQSGMTKAKKLVGSITYITPEIRCAMDLLIYFQQPKTPAFEVFVAYLISKLNSIKETSPTFYHLFLEILNSDLVRNLVVEVDNLQNRSPKIKQPKSPEFKRPCLFDETVDSNIKPSSTKPSTVHKENDEGEMKISRVGLVS